MSSIHLWWLNGEVIFSLYCNEAPPPAVCAGGGGGGEVEREVGDEEEDKIWTKRVICKRHTVSERWRSRSSSYSGMIIMIVQPDTAITAGNQRYQSSWFMQKCVSLHVLYSNRTSGLIYNELHERARERGLTFKGKNTRSSKWFDVVSTDVDA